MAQEGARTKKNGKRAKRDEEREQNCIDAVRKRHGE